MFNGQQFFRRTSDQGRLLLRLIFEGPARIFNRLRLIHFDKFGKNTAIERLIMTHWPRKREKRLFDFSKGDGLEMKVYAFKPLVFKELSFSGSDGPNRKCFSLVITNFWILSRQCNNVKCDSTEGKEPKPRSGHRIVCDDGNFYSFGGYLEINATYAHHAFGNAPGIQHLFEEVCEIMGCE